MYETVLWATDGSAGSDAALGEARRLAETCGGRIVAVHCDQRLDRPAAARSPLRDERDRRLKIRRQVEELRDAGVDAELVMPKSHREAADVVAETAAELGADVVVCGTRGLGALAGAFLGSFTQRLLQIAACPVVAVTVRETAEGESERQRVGAEA
jgi:nucleotide-binding universal stress UspA family protein